MVLKTKITKACPNENCSKYDKHFRGNIIKFGTQKNGSPRYKCTACGKTFGKTRDTILFNKHLTKEELIQICRLLAQKMSFRKISRKTNKHLDTIRNVAHKIGANYAKMKNYFKDDLELEESEVNAMITHIKTKKSKSKSKKQNTKTTTNKA